MNNTKHKRSWGLFVCQLLFIALVCAVCSYPADAQACLGTFGIDFDVRALTAGGIALGMAALPMSEAEFQEKVLDGVEEQGKNIDNIRRKFEAHNAEISNWSKERKQLHEDIVRLKKTANDSQADRDGVKRKLVELERLNRNEIKAACGNPLKRISDDPEKRTRFNVAIRLAMDKGGDMRALVAPQVKELGLDMDTLRIRALGEDSSPGSTIIDDALALELYDTLSTFGVWSQFAVRRLTTKQTKYPVKTARAVAQFINTEATAIADDGNKAGVSVTLEVELIGVLINVSRQLLEDAEIDITSDVGEDFAEAIANRLDVAALTANGTVDGDNGGMTGVFQGGTLVAAGAGEATVEALDREDFQSCLTAVDPIVLNRMAKWWCHPHVLVRMLSIADGNNRSLFQNALEAPAHGQVGSILGYPVSMAFAAPSSNTANARVATFGDPNGMVVGVRTDYSFESSDHHKWAEHQRSFKATMRAGTKIRRSQAFANLRLTT